MSTVWDVTGTSRSPAYDIFEIMARSERGERTTTSEVIISFHFLNSDLAEAIESEVLDPRQADLFRRVRSIHPDDFRVPIPWWKFWARPREITWLDYARRLGFDMNSFWSEKNGFGGIIWKVQEYLKARARMN